MSGMMKHFSHPLIAELKRYVVNKNLPLGPIVLKLSDLIKVRILPDSKQEEISARHKKLSEITDMMHAAHTFHRCVRDHTCDNAILADKRLHQDNVLSLLIGDYLLAQSSIDMADLKHSHTVGLLAKGLEDYTHGEFLRLQLLDYYDKKQLNLIDIRDSIERCAQLTCGSLLSNACLSAALLAGHPGRTEDFGSLTNIVFNFGFHTGSAQRLIEILFCPDTNSEADKAFIETLDISHFKNSIHRHIEKAVDSLLKLPDGDKRPTLLKMLSDMKNRC